MDVYEKPVLSPVSNITGSREVVQETKAFVKDMTALAPKRRSDSWNAPLGPVPVQTFLVHMMNFYGNLYKDAKLLENSLPLPLVQQREKWHGSFTAWMWIYF